MLGFSPLAGSPLGSLFGEPKAVFTINPTLQAGTVRMRMRADSPSAKQMKITLVDDDNASLGDTGWLDIDSVIRTIIADITATGAATGFQIDLQ